MEKSLILVATYNEAENIERLLKEVLKLKGNFDVLVIDDNSPDGTALIAENFAKKNKRVKVIVRKKNKGRGLASIAGYKYFYNSKYQYLYELDADFQEDPKDVLKLFEEAKKGDYDIVIGSRYVKGGRFKSHKKWLSLLVYSTLTLMFRTRIKDLTNWFHAIKRNVFNTVPYYSLKSKGFFLASELHLLAEKAGLKIKEIPIYFPPRQKGQSKVSIRVGAIFFKEFMLFWIRTMIKNGKR